jgi:hypothetical protein
MYPVPLCVVRSSKNTPAIGDREKNIDTYNSIVSYLARDDALSVASYTPTFELGTRVLVVIFVPSSMTHI